ncbi:hypothetical protein [Candidatus Methylocalor cossyra]|uniref:Cyanophycin synthetase n=1 Tax=Candidatus Methylocalor cossyra TaxID=3108543 RepID=A0ABM9NMH7_9GAMM
MRFPFASLLIAEIAPELGIRVELEPEFQFAGQLIFPDGRRHVFRNTHFNINPAGAVEIARDKGYTKFFLEQSGFPVARGKTFFSDALNRNLSPAHRRGMEEAVAFAAELGFPVYVKPNDLSQGILVAKVYREHSLREVARQIWQRSQVLLVEEVCEGRDYRVVVLGNKTISAYQRVPLSVTGDGMSSIDQLLRLARDKLRRSRRPNSDIDADDRRIDMKLESHGLSRDSVLAEDERVYVLDNANLCSGGESFDVTGTIHPEFRRLSVEAARVLGLRLAGVDIICADLTRDPAEQSWKILEINGAPGLDNYAALGPEQAERVRNLYREILLYLAETAW